MSNLRNGSLLKHASLGWSSSYTFLESALTLPRPLFISVSGAKANWRSGRLCLLSEGDSLTLRNAGLRFGSKADVCGATSHIRFTPNSDIDRVFPQTVVSALPPKADMGSAPTHVCFGPKADIRVGQSLTLISFATHGVFCGALPWPAPLDLGFQRET
jgi:hypothetical protein